MTEYALYLDDGGHPDDQPALVVAGYVASEEQWREFESKWRNALKRFGLSEPFHMTDFMSGTRLSPLRRDQILSALANIIKSSTARPFAAGMDMKAYKKVNATNVYPRQSLSPGDTIAYHSEKKRKRKRTVY
jgi:hypothetical protein